MKKLIIFIFLYILHYYSFVLAQTSLTVKSTSDKNEFYHLGSYVNKFGDIATIRIRDKEPQITIRSFSPILINFSANWEMYPLYIRGGAIDINENNNKLSFKGISNCETEMLTLLNKNNNLLFRASLGINWNTKMNYIETSKYFIEKYEDKIRIIDSLKNLCSIGQDFEYYLKREIKNTLITDLLAPFYDGKIDLDSISKDYVSLLNSWRIYVTNMVNEDNSFLRHGERAIYHYNQFLCRKYLNTDLEFRAQWDTAMIIFQDKTREFLLFKLLKNYHGKGIKNFSDYNNEFKYICKDKDYLNYLDSLGKINNHTFTREQLMTVLTDNKNNKFTWQDVLANNKGKVVYLDFWATWCAPCRFEIKNYPKLSQSLDDKNTIFVFISIDDNTEKWLFVTKQLGLDNVNHRHFIMKKNDALANFFKLETIPHYAIIDGKGKLISYDAPRPSDSKAIDIIKKLQLQK